MSSIVYYNEYSFDNTNNAATKSGPPILLRRLNTLQEGSENPTFERDSQKGSSADIQGNGLHQQQSVLSTASAKFREKQYGTIDVYWLFEDGGIVLFFHSLYKYSNLQ